MSKKKMKSSATRKLIPAIGMLTVSAMMLSSSTYAWFSMSDTVTVSGMSINATSEGGLVVTNGVATGDPGAIEWKSTADAAHATGANLLPTSTKNATNWYYNTSDDVNSAKAAQDASTYKTLTLAADANGIGKDSNAENGLTGYGFYLVNDFYIKSSTVEMTNRALQIRNLTVTPAAADRTSADLDKSLRVAVVLTDQAASQATTNTYIYNPLSGTGTYYVNGDSTNGAVTITTTPDDTSTNYTVSSITTIPANTATIDGASDTAKAIKASVYLYFEGEDANCKSANITSTLDDLDVSIKFGLAAAAQG